MTYTIGIGDIRDVDRETLHSELDRFVPHPHSVRQRGAAAVLLVEREERVETGRVHAAVAAARLRSASAVADRSAAAAREAKVQAEMRAMAEERLVARGEL